MALTYLKIFADMEETLSLYSDEERGRLLSAMMAYSFRGEEPELTGVERFVWPMLRNHIDSCEERSEKMKANGKRSGKTEGKPEANESEEKQTEAKLQQTKANGSKAVAKPSKTELIQEQEQDHEQEHVHDQDHKRTKGKRTRFVPPTPEEVQAYMLEHEGTHIQAAKFHAYWSSVGWKRQGRSMVDWKASARGWLLRDQETGYSQQQTHPVSQPQQQTTNPFLQMLAEEGYVT